MDVTTTKSYSQRMRHAAAAAALVISCIGPSTVTAQNPSLDRPYPVNDSPLTLPSGTVVRQRNLVLFRGHNVTALTITIETPTPATDSVRVAREAQEVATLLDTFAQTQGISRIAIEVCRSQACLEFREPAAERFQFVRATDGTWQPDRQHAP